MHPMHPMHPWEGSRGEAEHPRFWSSCCFSWGDPGLRPQRAATQGLRMEREKVRLCMARKKRSTTTPSAAATPPVAKLDDDDDVGDNIPGNPWDRMRAFLDRHGYGWSQAGDPSTRRCRFRATYGASSATFEALLRTFGTNGEHVRSLRLNSVTTDPEAVDPPSGFGQAVSMSFERERADVCDGHVGIISSKPSHGVVSGNDAIGMVVAIGRRFGCRSLDLSDASTKTCPEDGKSYNLRTARILSKGAGWYESKGFRSLIEELEPDTFARTVGRLHAIPLGDLIEALSAIDAAVRGALWSGKGGESKRIGKMRVAMYDSNHAEPEILSPPTTSDLVRLIDTASVALDVLSSRLPRAWIKGKTLGGAVDRLLKEDCPAARRLVDALLPKRYPSYPVLLSLPDGSEAPKLPMVEAFVYAWRLVSTFSQLSLTFFEVRPSAELKERRASGGA